MILEFGKMVINCGSIVEIEGALPKFGTKRRTNSKK